jgi:hypothetical protein
MSQHDLDEMHRLGFDGPEWWPTFTASELGREPNGVGSDGLS